jgi:serine palmitoyltransferase
MEQLPAAISSIATDLFEYAKPSYILLAVREFWDFVGPGGRLHPAYFLEHKGHLVIEGLLVVLIFLLFAQGRSKPKARAEEPLTDRVCVSTCKLSSGVSCNLKTYSQEVDQLCNEWYPEPLVPEYASETVQPPVIERWTQA